MRLDDVFTQRIEKKNDTGIISEMLRDSFNHAIKKLKIHTKDIIEVAVAVPATVDIKGMIIHAPNLGWKNIDLAKEFKDVFEGIPINI
ncbi:ROK family protein [Jeotgalicoccus sp. WY2]|uniref:ROK family protein n=1 Tax=Jeotgalicoccus sp. WY2 TaxID=2708346 RepID=UPI001BD1DDE0|nr:ROK family protein [Jeotgalicoccus sp. WY2]